MVGRKVAVLGAGSWGTALAQHLAQVGHSVSLWGRNKSSLEAIAKTRVNSTYFPNILLHKNIALESSLDVAVDAAQVIVLAVPSYATRSLCQQISEFISDTHLIVSTAKGIEASTFKRMSEVIRAEMPQVGENLVVLSGPSFASEVIEGKPTAVVAASDSQTSRDRVAEDFHYNLFRVYTSNDIAGVEYGGALKNVIAVAAGICDGMNLGHNARAALITRGLAELNRFVLRFGGQTHTVMGLGCLGDLLITTTGSLSRNRRVGIALGEGLSLDEATKSVGQATEGVVNAPLLLRVAIQEKIEVPIIEQVCQVIDGKVSVKEAMYSLLARDGRSEF